MSEDGSEPSADTGRSRRKSPIEQELQFALEPDMDTHTCSTMDIFHEDGEDEIMMFTPKIGVFGAPQCRCTTAVIALLALVMGITCLTGGACIIVFYVEVEPVVLSLGITLCGLGLLLSVMGGVMWCSEFMCNDCLHTAYKRMKDAPLKNALERRSRMASRTTNRTGSRLSKVSLRSGASNSSNVSMNTVSTKY